MRETFDALGFILLVVFGLNIWAVVLGGCFVCAADLYSLLFISNIQDSTLNVPAFWVGFALGWQVVITLVLIHVFGIWHANKKAAEKSADTDT